MDPRLLLSQLLKAREIKVPVGRMTFTIVRPSQMELEVMREPSDLEGRKLTAQLIQTKVVGWDGVLESDVIPGGASDSMEFDASLYRQWIADRKDLWPPLVEAFIKGISEHEAHLEAIKGN